MATNTTLLGLTKPDYAEFGDVAIQNSNLDLLDDAIAIRSRTPGMVVNGNFLDVVNQRGKTSYTGTGYGIDMWRTNYSGDVVAVVDGGVKNTSNSATNGWHMHQIIPAKRWGIAGQKLTLVADVKEFLSAGIRLVCSFRDASDTEISNVNARLANGIVAVSGTAPANTNRLRVGLYAYSGTIVGDHVTLKNIDLYFGTYTADKHPIFVPKRYSGELMECRRYYQRRSTGNINPIDLCPLMAGTPTVSSVDGVYEYVVDPNEVIA